MMVFSDVIMQPLAPRHRTMNYIEDELTSFTGDSDQFTDIFLSMDPYTNNDLKNLSAVCACFTDVAYWQFIRTCFSALA